MYHGAFGVSLPMTVHRSAYRRTSLAACASRRAGIDGWTCAQNNTVRDCGAHTSARLCSCAALARRVDLSCGTSADTASCETWRVVDDRVVHMNRDGASRLSARRLPDGGLRAVRNCAAHRGLGVLPCRAMYMRH